MKILIVEGIATSGKSVIAEKLQDSLMPKVIQVYKETETHEPIMKKTDEPHVDFFKDLVLKALNSDKELVIFERLYLTQACRANVTLAEYAGIEDLLASQSVLTVLLQVNEKAIAERVRLAAGHREESWGEYVKTKGSTFDEIAEYYIAQQRKLLELLKESKLPYKVFESTSHGYDEICEQIISELGLT